MNNYEMLMSKPKRIAKFIADHIYCPDCICKSYCIEHEEERSEIGCDGMIYNWFKEEYDPFFTKEEE